MPGKNAFRSMLLLWAAVFVAVMAVSLYAPLWIRLPVLIAFTPATTVVSHRILFGRRAARRQWLLFRFVLANWNRTSVIVERGLRRGLRRGPTPTPETASDRCARVTREGFGLTGKSKL